MNNSDVTDLGLLVSRVGWLETRVAKLEQREKLGQPGTLPKLDNLDNLGKLEALEPYEPELVEQLAPLDPLAGFADSQSICNSQPVPVEVVGSHPSKVNTSISQFILGYHGAPGGSLKQTDSQGRLENVKNTDRGQREDSLDDEKNIANESSRASDDNLKSTESLEARIGLYWLSKLGIGFLVVGVSLLIMYTFKNFGPAAKIATGFIVASVLMAVGEYLERRDNIPWYARLLEGGAWALGYFTTYAMYHVNSVKIISDPLIDLILMLGVSGLAIAHSINKKSEIMAIFSVTLGFLTLALSHVSSFSASASAILVLLSVILSTRQKWYQLYLYSIFASYGALIACGSLYSAATDPREQFQLVSLLLAPSLIGFGLVPIYMSEKINLTKQTIVIGTVVNACAFCALFFPQAYDYLGTAASVYNLTIGMWFFAVAILCKRSGLNAAATVNSLFALTVSTLYFSGAHYGRGTWIFLAAELAVLAWSGLRFKLKSFRWFALALGVVILAGNFILMAQPGTSLVFGHYLPFSLCASLCAISAMGLSAYLQKKPSLQNNAAAKELKFAFYTNWNMALMIAWTLPLALISVSFDHIGRLADALQTPALLFSWCGIAVVVMAMAIRLCSPYMQVVTILLFATAGIPACAGWHFSWVNSSVAVALMFAAAFVFKHYAARLSATKSMAAFHTQFLSAYCCAALLPSGAHCTSGHISVYLAIQAILVLVLGLHMRDKFIRLIAPVAFGLTAISLSMHSLEWGSVVPVVTSFYLAWALYLLPGDYGIDKAESELRHVYSVVAAIILASFFAVKLQETWISCAWALQAFTILAVGFVMREKTMRITGLGIFCMLVFRLLCFDLPHDLDWAFIVPIVSCLYLAWALYLVPGEFGIDQTEIEIRHIYSVGAAIVLTSFLGMKLEKTWISCAWALEGFTMLALGFVMREKVMRISGLVVFASLVYRLLIIDLAGAETIYRIFAFIVAGLVLLLSAYAYSWFAKRFGTAGISSYGPRGCATPSVAVD
jgi:uncharacterized membrane protein